MGKRIFQVEKEREEVFLHTLSPRWWPLWQHEAGIASLLFS